MWMKYKLPKLAETSDVVVVDSWLVEVGQVVESGQALASVETDKVTVEVPSPVAGTVVELLAEEGDEVRTGDHFCVIEV